MIELHPTTQATYEAIQTLVRAGNDRPSIREIMRAAGQTTSSNTVYQLRILESKKLIRWDRTNRARGISLIEAELTADELAFILSLLNESSRAGGIDIFAAYRIFIALTWQMKIAAAREAAR